MYGFSICRLCTFPKRGRTRGRGVIQVSGTVEFISLEGGFYAIRAADGKTYDPINLPQEYHHHGMRVRVKARMRGDVASVHMAGPIIEILSIEKR